MKNILEETKENIKARIEGLYDTILFEMDLRKAGIKLDYKKKIKEAMQDLMNRLIKRGYNKNRYYMQTHSFVSFKVNGKIVSYPLFMVTGFYDKRKTRYPNIEYIDKGTGVSHLMAHINNIRKLKGKNYRDGVDKNGRKVSTSQVSFDCYVKALDKLEEKLKTVLDAKNNDVIYQTDNKGDITGLVIKIPISYADEQIMFTFVIDIPIDKRNQISTLVAGYSNKNSNANLKLHS